MKSFLYFTSVLLMIAFDLFSQETDEYYKLPSQRNDVRNNAYPNLNRKALSLYVGIEGGFKQNYFSQSNYFNNLASGQKNNDLFWGVELGYNMNDQWAVETGYYKNPSFFVQTISSGRGLPFIYRLGTNLQTIPLRYKYKILTLDAITKTAAIYVGAGVLLATNAKNQQLLLRNFTGVTGPQRDSIKLKSETFLKSKGIAQLELSLELRGKISNSLSVAIFGRGNFGANGIVQSNLIYSINANKIAETQQLLKGISYNFGLVLRYDLARGYKYKSLKD
ncbi:hypothetical protein [Emticicia sp. SJ17W-69]|uniref:hypothetical protein n=1 Tax=Emticicia sp. SJ17W-69 TaxID=3421657 RepID=UPI003EB95F68